MAMTTLVSAQMLVFNQFLKETLTVHKLITVYTYFGIRLEKDIKQMSFWVAQMLMMAVWLFTTLIVTLGNSINWGKHFQTPTPVSPSDRRE